MTAILLHVIVKDLNASVNHWYTEALKCSLSWGDEPIHRKCKSCAGSQRKPSACYDSLHRESIATEILSGLAEQYGKNCID
jgi:hypothetical protein